MSTWLEKSSACLWNCLFGVRANSLTGIVLHEQFMGFHKHTKGKFLLNNLHILYWLRTVLVEKVFPMRKTFSTKVCLKFFFFRRERRDAGILAGGRNKGTFTSWLVKEVKVGPSCFFFSESNYTMETPGITMKHRGQGRVGEGIGWDKCNFEHLAIQFLGKPMYLENGTGSTITEY